jgi:hypothetical protein
VATYALAVGGDADPHRPRPLGQRDDRDAAPPRDVDDRYRPAHFRRDIKPAAVGEEPEVAWPLVHRDVEQDFTGHGVECGDVVRRLARHEHELAIGTDRNSFGLGPHVSVGGELSRGGLDDRGRGGVLVGDVQARSVGAEGELLRIGAARHRTHYATGRDVDLGHAVLLPVDRELGAFGVGHRRRAARRAGEGDVHVAPVGAHVDATHPGAQRNRRHH